MDKVTTMPPAENFFYGQRNNLRHSMTQAIPFGDRLLVRPDKAPEQTKGGVIIDDETREEPATGTVVSLGYDVITDPKTGQPYPKENVPQPGQRILYQKYSGIDVESEGEKLIILRKEQVHLGFREVEA